MGVYGKLFETNDKKISNFKIIKSSAIELYNRENIKLDQEPKLFLRGKRRIAVLKKKRSEKN